MPNQRNSILGEMVRCLREEGVAVGSEALFGAEVANGIKLTLVPLFDSIRFNAIGNTKIVSHTQYIEYPFWSIEDLHKIVLNPKIVSLVGDFFGEQPILTKCRVQTKIAPHRHGIRPHSDPDNGIGVIHYITDTDTDNGATIFYKGTHSKVDKLKRVSSQIDDADYYSEESVAHLDCVGRTGYKAGSFVVFDRSIVHAVPPYQKPGRIVILSIFHPESLARKMRVSHLVSTESLRSMTEDEKICMGLEMPALSRLDKPLVSKYDKPGVYKNSFFRQLIWIVRWQLYKAWGNHSQKGRKN